MLISKISKWCLPHHRCRGTSRQIIVKIIVIIVLYIDGRNVSQIRTESVYDKRLCMGKLLTLIKWRIFGPFGSELGGYRFHAVFMSTPSFMDFFVTKFQVGVHLVHVHVHLTLLWIMNLSYLWSIFCPWKLKSRPTD